MVNDDDDDDDDGKLSSFWFYVRQNTPKIHDRHGSVIEFAKASSLLSLF